MAGNKRGTLLLALILVTLLLAGGVAYNALAGSRQATAAQAAAAAGGSGDASVSNAAEACGEVDDAPLLANFDATVYDEAGNPISLTTIADGRPLVINIWATWCPYCLDEMPDLEAIHEKYGDRVAFAFVDATDGVRETVEGASSWLSENGFENLPAYYDIDYDLISTYGVRSYPTTIIVSGAGEILTVSPGRIDPALVSGALETLV